eukprot:397712-Amphidinium_carterae.1
MLSAGATAGAVPTIDLGKSDEEICNAMFEAATTVGFFQVINHGIMQADINEVFQTSKTFFARPLADKQRDSAFAAEMNSGYECEKQ